jgi:lipoic acid synthetase
VTALIPEGATRLTVVGVPTVTQRKPAWLKQRAPLAGPNYREIKQVMRGRSLHTVCEEAGCPNISECWEDREATFLIGGEDCTRRCGFCQIATGKPRGYDRDEPRRVAETVADMGLHFAVVTGVARDDLDDKAAWLYAETCRQIHARLPDCGVELLIDDFQGDAELLRLVLEAKPQVLAHNLETVRRLFRHVRPAFDYDRSLQLLDRARRWSNSATKSNLMLGLGETPDEVRESMRDLRAVGCQILTIGQYLQPTHKHLALQRFAEPAEFARYAAYGRELGFDHVEAGPLVRSSYRAGRQASNAGAWQRPTGAVVSSR